jgi:hypothetical protein
MAVVGSGCRLGQKGSRSRVYKDQMMPSRSDFFRFLESEERLSVSKLDF